MNAYTSQPTTASSFQRICEWFDELRLRSIIGESKINVKIKIEMWKRGKEKEKKELEKKTE